MDRLCAAPVAGMHTYPAISKDGMLRFDLLRRQASLSHGHRSGRIRAVVGLGDPNPFHGGREHC
jgi:hypothetical protein